MLIEDYVSFETAKLLKAKGFENSEPTCINVFKGHIHKIQDRLIHADDDVTIPTLQMAMKWLREVHNLHIMVDCIGAENYMPTIQFTRNGKDIEIKSKISKIGGNGFDSYEQAIDASIKYCLENLI